MPVAAIGSGRRLAGFTAMLDSNREAVDPASTGTGSAAHDAAQALADAADTIDRVTPDLADDLKQTADAT